MAEAVHSGLTLQTIGVSEAEQSQLRSNAEQVASFVRLPFRSELWRGTSGACQGVGIGSSVDFQDHRQYLPGDDPRYINWQAYARTGNYTMKLYREEVSPQMDLVLDVSSSMFVDLEKSSRVLELFYFLVSSATHAGARLSCFQVSPLGVRAIELEAIRTGDWELSEDLVRVNDGQDEAPQFHSVPWRSHASRVLVSDLLFRGAPETMLSEIAPANSPVWIFCPWSNAEKNPEWLGNVELENCETGLKRELRMTDRELQIYQQRYRQHFNLWHEASAKRGFGLARVDSSSKFQEALMKEPLSIGLVELWN